MRMLAAVLFLSLCSAPLSLGQKYRLSQSPENQNTADYTIKVHISATHFRTCALVGAYSTCRGGIYADATLNGKKVELFGTVDKKYVTLIVPGDYLARLMKEKPRDGGNAVLFQQYFVLLPDKSAWPCQITGFSE